MSKPTKTQIAADLREIKTLTLLEIEQINGLRATRRSVQTRLDNLPTKKVEYEAAIKDAIAKETEILKAAQARMVPATPPPALQPA